jgi:SAM-dependent methyltransferase
LGHDAAFLAQQGILTAGFDLSETALARAEEVYPFSNLQWVKGDLFTDLPHQAYDLVWEHTCYCAIDPSQREGYVQSMHQALTPGGQLLGIFLLDTGGDPHEGPPFGSSLEEVKWTFEKQFELEWEVEPSVSFPGREGREYLMLWKAR